MGSPAPPASWKKIKQKVAGGIAGKLKESKWEKAEARGFDCYVTAERVREYRNKPSALRRGKEARRHRLSLIPGGKGGIAALPVPYGTERVAPYHGKEANAD